MIIYSSLTAFILVDSVILKLYITFKIALNTTFATCHETQQLLCDIAQGFRARQRRVLRQVENKGRRAQGGRAKRCFFG